MHFRLSKDTYSYSNLNVCFEFKVKQTSQSQFYVGVVEVDDNNEPSFVFALADMFFKTFFFNVPTQIHVETRCNTHTCDTHKLKQKK